MYPWNKAIIEIDPKTGYSKWIFKVINGKMVPNFMAIYGCIDKLMIIA